MKKTSILIAVFAVIATATPMVQAAEFSINFDGGSTASSFFKANSTLPEVGTPVHSTPPTATTKAGNALFHKLGNAGRQELRRILPESGIFNRQIVLLLKSEEAEVMYNANSVVFVNPIGAEKYNTLLKTENIQLLNAISKIHSARIAQNRHPICVIVEAIVIHYLWKLIDNVWTQVAEEAVEYIEQCHEGPSYPTTGGPDCSNGPQRASI